MLNWKLMKSFSGKVVGRIIEARFAFSGKISGVRKNFGDKVTSGELIASLDRKSLQAELDKQLSDYERARAEFDMFNSQAQADSDNTKFLRTAKQAALNASVKDVELAKQKLDQADLVSPTDGIVLEANNLVAGIYATPANSSVKILDTSSLMFEFVISQKDIPLFMDHRDVEISFPHTEKITAQTKPLFFGDEGKFMIRCQLPKNEKILVGMIGEVGW